MADRQTTSERGFAAMDDEKQREIASEGGRAAHASGHAHEFDSEEARAAGRKGGEAVSRDRQHMAEIGRMGGLAHSEAASHHEAAAHHHRQAAHYHEEGNYEQARSHSARAHEHSGRANEKSFNAHSHTLNSAQGRGWFGDSEGHAEAGRKGGEARGRSDEDDNGRSGQRGGSHEQHVEAGRQSHKNQ